MQAKLIILGSGSATPLRDRHHSSQVFQFERHNIMLDCGEGTQWQLLKHNVRYQKLDAICITHLHGDHYLGLMGLLNTMSLQGRRNKLSIISPPGLREVFQLHMKLSNAHDDFPVEWIETNPEKRSLVWSDEYLSIENIPLEHRIPCNGYLISYRQERERIDVDRCDALGLSRDQLGDLLRGIPLKDATGKLRFKDELCFRDQISLSYAYLSDTRFLPELAKDLGTVDLLFHEATFLNNLADRAVQTFHSTANDAARFAVLSKAKRLIVGHFSSRYRDLEGHFDEANAIFPGIELAEEGSIFTLDPVINKI